MRQGVLSGGLCSDVRQPYRTPGYVPFLDWLFRAPLNEFLYKVTSGDCASYWLDTSLLQQNTGVRILPVSCLKFLVSKWVSKNLPRLFSHILEVAKETGSRHLSVQKLRNNKKLLESRRSQRVELLLLGPEFIPSREV